MTSPVTDAATWRIEVVVPRRAAAGVARALEPLCAAVSWFDRDDAGRVHGYALARPDASVLARVLAEAAAELGIAAAEPRLAQVTPRDWLAETVRQFPPITVGRYFVHSAHFADSVPAGRIGLRIGAGSAFGSGEHPSTAGCLLALDRLARRRFAAPLDMGCGSGILALAMVKTWRRPVLACDADAEAVRVTRRNARANGVLPLVRAIESRGYGARALRRAAPFDLVCANILARPLMRMAPHLARSLRAGGTAVLSGFLGRDAGAVLAAQRRVGLRLARRITVGDWHTLVLRR